MAVAARPPPPPTPPRRRGGYTIFGECAPLKVVHDIAGVKVRGSAPEDRVTIEKIRVARKKSGDEPEAK